MAKKILVVDDELYMHKVMQFHLERAGYELISAHNGREAVEKTTTENPNLVLMDVMMPEMDGLSALKEIKGAETTRDIPVIMLTSSAHTLTRKEAEASGAAMFMTKPFSPTHLLKEIKGLLDKTEG